MLGVFVSGGVSGGHINPAITLSMAIFRRFVRSPTISRFEGQTSQLGLSDHTDPFTGSLKLVVPYLVQDWNYSTAINLYEGGTGARTIEKTGGLFFTSKLPYTTNYLCFYNEVLMTAILMIFVVAVGDEGNTAPPKNLGPFVVFWVVFGLASTLGMQVSFYIRVHSTRKHLLTFESPVRLHSH
ncbi:hypothetical protein PGTUg99_003767 [Puccinia graminis f. sp. tritici]|uniref:Aquaporin n=1 Tax=Puccinia graminis f. sp. tritici TaxID=56615 RepID=A0A5B0S3P9_PUCGR|nr:hypothetical protein PGTUg99_003767 [Puccinia graminis f. sp. tritici]